MKKSLQSLLVIATLASGTASAQKFLWADMVNAPGSSGAYGIVADTVGNTITVGQYAGTAAAFGTIKLNSVAGSSDVFIAKMTAAGAYVWVQSAGGKGSDNGNDAVLDALGNVYVVGTIGDTATFGSITLNHANGGFIAMYNSAGVCQWATYIPAGYVSKIAMDGSGNLYVTGNYSSSITIGTSTLTSVGSEDIFVAKYNKNGVAQWAVSMGGPNDEQSGIGSIAVDKSGNVYVANDMYGHGMVGTLNVKAKAKDSLAVFVAKYNTNGNFLWAKQAIDSSNWANGIAWNKKTNALYITGSLTGTATFGTVKVGPATGIYYNPFIVEMDTAGNFGWGLVATCPNWAKGSGITTDTAGNVYATGYAYGTLNLGGSDNVPLSTGAGFDANILKANSSGVWQWGKVTGNNEFVYNDGGAISTDKAGNIYHAARFTGTSTFDGHSIVGSLSVFQAYTCKLSPVLSTGITEQTMFGDVSIYPNPVCGNLNVRLNSSDLQEVVIRIMDINGQLVFAQKLSTTSGENSTLINTLGYSKGMYFVQLLTERGSLTKKIVVE